MQKTKNYILSFILILLLQVNLSSQVKFNIGPSLGLTIPTGDYSGSTIEYYNGTKYGLGSGLNFGAVFKARLPVFTVRADVYYSSLDNTGNSEPAKGYVEVKHSIFTIGAGPEFSFKLPGSSLAPYIGAELLLTSFSGETTFLEVSKVPDGTFSMSSATRTGLGIGAGAEFSIGKKYLLDFGFKYNLLNLFGKTTSVGPDRIHSYVELNDDNDPLYPDDKHPILSDRTISVIQINAAFLFGF